MRHMASFDVPAVRIQQPDDLLSTLDTMRLKDAWGRLRIREPNLFDLDK
jgi:hypothetical protein